MKNSKRFLIATAALALFASAGQVKAGGTDSCCDDNIAASPKVRAMIDERKAACCAAPSHVSTTQTITRQTDVTASPKLQQMRAGQAATLVVQASETAGYRTIGSDGIAASPKVRSVLDERKQTVEIAPLK
jgi:hypothetical protein